MKNTTTIKIGELEKEIDNSIYRKDVFDVDFDGHYLIQIEHTQHGLEIINAMNGYGENCYKEFKDKKVIAI